MPSQRSRSRKVADTVLIGLFFAGLGIPSAITLLDGIVLTRHGKPASGGPCPSLQLSSAALQRFPAQYEQYLNEHFFPRRTLLRWHNLVQVSWLANSFCSTVIVGKQGWLFYSGLPSDTTAPHLRPFQPQELEQWRRVLEARRDWLADRGIPYLLVIAPDKQSIYPEMLPPGLQCQEQTVSRQDQLLAYLRSHATVDVLDLRPSLRQAKAVERVYFRTDSHWNDRGAFVAYQQILAALAARFPELTPLPRSAFQAVTRDMPGGDLAQMLKLSDRLHDDKLELLPLAPLARRTSETVPMNDKARLPHLQPIVMERAGAAGRKALVFYDSFGELLVPFLSEHFARTVYLPEDVLDPAMVERERPDVVIQEIVERKLRLFNRRDEGTGPAKPVVCSSSHRVTESTEKSQFWSSLCALGDSGVRNAGVVSVTFPG